MSTNITKIAEHWHWEQPITNDKRDGIWRDMYCPGYAAMIALTENGRLTDYGSLRVISEALKDFRLEVLLGDMPRVEALSCLEGALINETLPAIAEQIALKHIELIKRDPAQDTEQ